MNNSKTNKKRYVSANVIAKYLNLSPLTLGRWRSEKRNLPYYLFGGAVKYDFNEVIGITESSKVNVGGVRLSPPSCPNALDKDISIKSVS